jgi:deoxyribodipyrimidine photo-lyase
LGVHFRFGTISIREKARKALIVSDTWLNRTSISERFLYDDFVSHFPHVAQSSFRPEYDKIEWRNDESDFKGLA